MYSRSEIIIKQTHRALWYEDGKFVKVLEPGRHELPKKKMFGPRVPEIDIKHVDMRERDFTIKGQEILTADKVAIRVSIIVRFRVIDAVAALHEVEEYEDRVYSDVQLAARRSLASMTLEEILRNRNQLSEDILADVREPAELFGVAIQRADVKDLIFPGNLQDVMNRVLTAERLSQAHLVEARTEAERRRIEAEADAEIQQRQAEANATALRVQAAADAEATRVRQQAEIESTQQREALAKTLSEQPAMLRLVELEALRELATNAHARIVIGFDKHNEVNVGD